MFNTLPFLSGCSSSFRQAHLGFRLWRWALFLSVLCPKWQMTKLNVAVTWNPNFFSDATLNEAAQILRLLHIEELRELQTKINEAIVAVQAIIADPKTDHRLGKVGRWERGRGGKLKTDRLNYGSIGHKFFFFFFLLLDKTHLFEFWRKGEQMWYFQTLSVFLDSMNTNAE